jgi:hypothetical protein
VSEPRAKSAASEGFLQRNSTGDQVDVLKRMLAAIGLDPGPLGEPFGTRTYRAVKEFQARSGVVPDGVVGPDTWAALERAVRERTDQRHRDPVEPEPSVTEHALPPNSSRIPLSSSVQNVTRRRDAVTAAELAKRLWEDHRDYPSRSQAIDVLTGFRAPPSSPRRPAEEWVDAVRGVLDEDHVAVAGGGLHGKLLIVGLTKLEPALENLLETEGILADLRRTMTPDPEVLFRATRPALLARRRADDAKLVSDAPAEVDLLDREGFASVLARLLRNQRNHRGFGQGPLLVHLYGPWGAGKTSLAGFVRRAFERPEAVASPDGPVPDPWLFVVFNAWKHQRVAPPWWWLMDAIYHDAVRRRRRHGGLPLWRRVRVWAWRWGFVVLALVAISALVTVAAVLGVLSIELVWQTESAVKAIMAFLVTAGSAVALIRSTRASLLVGSPRAASALVRSGGDPFRRLHERFRTLIRHLGRRLVVFVDDLDRCQPSYVVELLEGIQTIFTDVPVTYLVAADREWVGESFQKVYGDFRDVMGRPGRPLGYLFLEKTFAVSAPLPRPSAAAQQRYRAAVLAGRDTEEPITPEARKQAARMVGSGSIDAAVEAAAGFDVADGSAMARAVREAAAAVVADAIVEGEEDALLRPYLDMVEQNPRALKRLRNAYAIATVGRLTSGDIAAPDGHDGLVRWTILSLRWPRLASYVAEHPERLASIAAGDGGAGGDDVPADLSGLRSDHGLIRLLTADVGEHPSTLVDWVADEFGAAPSADPRPT